MKWHSISNKKFILAFYSINTTSSRNKQLLDTLFWQNGTQLQNVPENCLHDNFYSIFRAGIPPQRFIDKFSCDVADFDAPASGSSVAIPQQRAIPCLGSRSALHCLHYRRNNGTNQDGGRVSRAPEDGAEANHWLTVSNFTALWQHLRHRAVNRSLDRPIDSHRTILANN